MFLIGLHLTSKHGLQRRPQGAIQSWLKCFRGQLPGLRIHIGRDGSILCHLLFCSFLFFVCVCGSSESIICSVNSIYQHPQRNDIVTNKVQAFECMCDVLLTTKLCEVQYFINNSGTGDLIALCLWGPAMRGLVWPKSCLWRILWKTTFSTSF